MSLTLSRSLHRLAVVGGSALLLGTASLAAQAQGNLTITNGPGTHVSVFATTLSPSAYSVDARSFLGTLSGGPASVPPSFEAYCVDLAASVAPLSTPYAVTVASGSNLNRYGQVFWLEENALLLYVNHPGYTAAEQRASMQLAIWNTLYDSDQTITTGTFRADVVPSNDVTLANLFLTDSTNKTSTGARLVDNSGHGYQTLIVGTPEPGAVASFSILSGGCLTLLGRRRFKRNRKRN